MPAAYCQRAAAALRAISDRCSAVSLSARALPPLSPPLRPSATAAGSRVSSGGSGLSSSVASATMDAARLLRSTGRLRDRSGIGVGCHAVNRSVYKEQ